MPPQMNNKQPARFQRFQTTTGETSVMRNCIRLIGFATVLFGLALFSVGCSDAGSAKLSGAGNNSSTPPTEKGGAGSVAKVSASKSSGKASKSGADKADTTDKSVKKIQVSTEPDINEPQFHEALLSAIEEYLHFGMVNSIVIPKSADSLDMEDEAPQPFMSESGHEPSHGNKLYFLFAKEIGHYTHPQNQPAPAGQAIVMESWTSKPSNPAARNLISHASGNRVNPRSTIGNKTLEIGKRHKFFVMTKLAKDAPKTDQGWVYGVIDADSREVVASGKVASCMSCHVEADNDRLFGSKQISFEEKITEVKTPQTKSAEAPKKNPEVKHPEKEAFKNAPSKK